MIVRALRTESPCPKVTRGKLPLEKTHVNRDPQKSPVMIVPRTAIFPDSPPKGAAPFPRLCLLLYSAAISVNILLTSGQSVAAALLVLEPFFSGSNMANVVAVGYLKKVDIRKEIWLTS